jgi:hypothetical protein
MSTQQVSPTVVREGNGKAEEERTERDGKDVQSRCNMFWQEKKDKKGKHNSFKSK